MSEQVQAVGDGREPDAKAGHAALQRMALRDLWRLSRECTQRRQAAETRLKDITEQTDRHHSLLGTRLKERSARLRQDQDRKAAARQQDLKTRETHAGKQLEESLARRLKQVRDEVESAQVNLSQQQEDAQWVAESMAEAAAQDALKNVRECQRKGDELLAKLKETIQRTQKAIHRLGHKPAVTDGGPEETVKIESEGSPGQRFAAYVTTAEQLLARMERMTLAVWIRGLWPWITILLLAAAGGGAGYLAWLIRSLGGQEGLGPAFMASLGAAAGFLLAFLVVVCLWLAVGRRLRACEREIYTAAATARAWHQRWIDETAAHAKYRKDQADHNRKAELEKTHHRFKPIMSNTEHIAAERLKAAEKQAAAERENWTRASREKLAKMEDEIRQAKTKLETRIARWTELNQTHRDRTLRKTREDYEREMGSIQEAWDAGQARVGRMMKETAQFTGATMREWDDPAWNKWTPPTDFPQVVRFGRLVVDVKGIMSGLPRQRPYDLGLPAKFELPALLAFPDGASVLLESGLDERSAAVAALQAMMTRILTSLPPGRAHFTLIDPVGLGRNFAGFMHLADHNEQLVGPRIWTETDQIDQRLVDLTNHMENVIQKYLRNEFATIDQYNAQAGELAEPYRFLVIADFPTNFSDDAVHRIAAIMSSGARCGVYCLIASDPGRPLPGSTTPDMLRKHAVNLVYRDGKFVWRDEVYEPYQLVPDSPAPETFLTGILHKVGEAAIDASRVQVPFAAIAPQPGQMWSRRCDQELVVPAGRTGATRQHALRLGKGMAQHALIAGKTGSGKSTLLHVLVTNLAMWYSPQEVEFYLIDFKKGVEFKTYATHRVPHARAVAIESDREFGLSVLFRLDEELKRRGELFRASGVQDLAGYRQTSGAKPMPRVLLMVDEFQEFFSEDDKIAQDAGLLLDRLVRQGRAFGVHVILSSQTLSGSSGLSRSTIGQMSVRVALQCNESDSQLILSDSNTAARLLTRPGEAVYNDAGGLSDSNNLFQVSWLGDSERDRCLAMVEQKAAGEKISCEPTIVFEGNADADWSRNAALSRLMDAAGPPADRKPPRLWLGEAVAIKEPTNLALTRQSGANLLVIGQRDESAASIFVGAAMSLAAQHRPNEARFVVLDGSPAGSHMEGKLAAAMADLPLEARMVAWREVEAVIDELARELAGRQGQEQGAMNAQVIYLFIYGLQRYRMLRKQEDNFAFSSSSEPAKPKTDQQFMDILRDGPAVGMHALIWIDTPASLERTIGRQALREFDHRVLFQMSANDSSNLIDSPAANHLGFHRALYFSEEQGVLEKFRPYAFPSAEWIAACKQKLATRKK
ncbi:MAG: cell division protein FtsK [Planctomycetes bacterium]|nr:cell division protein FtsK [Planctomycetota bacterium]